MKALVLRGPRQAEAVEVARPRPEPGQVLVRVRACGVCGSDLNAWRGVPGIEYPLPPGQPGHEVWGEVAEVGSAVDGLWVGEVATGMAQPGYAEYVLAEANDLIKLADDRPLLGEPLACAANVVRRAAIRPEDRLAIVGFGYLAALIVLLLRQRRWVAVSRRPDSRDLALNLGAEAAYAFDEVPTACWDSFPVVIESAGLQRTLDYATWLVGNGGRLVIAGYHADGPRSVNLQTWNGKGIDVINAHERQPDVYRRGLRAGLDIVRQYQLNLTSLITHAWSLERAAEAFTALEQRPSGFIKGVIQL
jgi:threonine dehydrogenase-like Zn-dependent dehydrogenase